MKKTPRIILAVLIGTALTALSYYLMLPALNVFNTGFWTYLILVAFFYGLPLGVVSGLSVGAKNGQKATPTGKLKVNKIFLAIIAIPVAVLVLGGVVSSTFFNARKYASVIQVDQADFAQDMPEADVVSNISLMDTASASILGNRELGALSNVVSQYNLSPDYNQINYKGTPKKVANLEYVDFFRWINNSANGVPGYVMVDPVNNDADYIQFEQPMIYVDSAFFGEDLMRKLRFSYPTKIFSSVNFEIDEEGNPYYIVSCMKPRVGLFGAMDVSEVIIFNPCDGTSEIYPVDSSPSWIDNVYDGDLACEKYNWYGTLAGGFWNSVIGNRDCKTTTDGYGYIVRGDDVWYYTGVTSVTSDESNIGFIISNARTGEYKYYPVIGAEEYSAMGAAQGEVQEKRYTASFPSLINVEGEATYIMVLKDENGLVKLYALVNVKNYSIVATGDSQTSAKQAYLEELAKRGVITEEDLPAPETQNASILVKDVRLATVGGETVVYITAEDGIVYRGQLASDESLILVEKGMSLSVSYSPTSHEKIRVIIGWSESNP
ncbi:MAG: hypothetical protein E7610_03945 [Ruminococcaceae bacterium]|nr:hypothetical protein [Oscillospiraceae bacterium]